MTRQRAMTTTAQTLEIERKGFWSPELVVSTADGRVWRVSRKAIDCGNGQPYVVEARGHCQRAFTLRDPVGRPLAAALPLQGCRTGYEIALRGGERASIERRYQGWFRSAIEAHAVDRTLLRFESRPIFRPQLANLMTPMAAELAAFLVFLCERIYEAEAAGATAAAV